MASIENEISGIIFIFISITTSCIFNWKQIQWESLKYQLSPWLIICTIEISYPKWMATHRHVMDYIFVKYKTDRSNRHGARARTRQNLWMPPMTWQTNRWRDRQTKLSFKLLATAKNIRKIQEVRNGYKEAETDIRKLKHWNKQK